MKRLFFNGNIITMTDEKCNAILVEDEKIIGVGVYEKFKSIDAVKYDLCGKTLIPSFIDAHSHLSSYANSFLQASLENAEGFDDIKSIISEFINKNNVKADAWVIANSYDDNKLPKKIDKNFLDEISKTNPIVVQHKNGHNGVFNGKAIQLLGIDTHDGILEEKEYMKYVEKIPMPNIEALSESYLKAQNRYLQYGITHIQEGILVKQMIPIYKYLLDNNKLFLDTVVYPDMESFDEFKALYPNSVGKYYRHMKIGGIKIILDGSPQSKTAWMKTPYKNSNDFGYGVMSDEEVYNAVKKAITENVQIIAHCNGDRAVEQYISTLEKFEIEDIRRIKPVIIHAQLIDIDQLDRVKRLGVILSVFVAHVYHFGDIHIKNFGFDRASVISPTRSALSKGIVFTFHQDTPVIEPNITETLWCAVNRMTKDGVLLGENERIDVGEALKAQTINGAYQYGEDDVKGSIEVGKYADFVVLDKNILTVNPMEIKDIKIEDVVYRGDLICI